MSERLKTLQKIMCDRRSVREFDSEFELKDEVLNHLLDLARYVPTAFNLQHERFLKVKNPEMRCEIRAASWNQAQVTEASALIIVCADLKAWRKSALVHANAPKEIQTLYVDQLIPAYYSGKTEIERDEAFRSASMASYALMLAAQAEGLSTCPIGGFDFDAVGKIINLPQDYVMIMMIAVGKEKKAAPPRLTQLPLEEFIKTDRF